MSARIDVQMDKADLRRFRRAMRAKPAEIRRAGNRAVRKTVRWGVTQIVRELASQSQIPQRVLKAGGGHKRAVRVRTRMPTGSRTAGYLWVGVNPVKAIYVGKPRKLKKAVRVGKHRFDGAFLATMKSGHRGVFKRSRKSRLPIVEQTVPLQGADSAIERLQGRIQGQLRKTFMHELNYEINIKGQGRGR